MSERFFGTVARWTDRGFGFIEADHGGKYFCHFNNIRNAGVDGLPPGQRVSFEVGIDGRTQRPKCILVDVVGELPAQEDGHRALADQAFMRDL